MSWSVETSRALLILLALGGLAGCYESHRCGAPEECNYEDDDCDDKFDEGFVDERGRYFTTENCGGCGVSCAEVFPTAAETACEIDFEGTPQCVIVSCPIDFHLAGTGACVPDVPSLCLPCTTDADCELRVVGARCLTTASGAQRCGQPCGGEAPECPEGFGCDAGQCFPTSGWCGCDATTEGAELACVIERPEDGRACAGVMLCGPDGAGECLPALTEACNMEDDDCNGEVDEIFRDEEGRYVDRLNCGGCAIPCVEPGPNMLAECLPSGPVPGVRCEVDCLEGFVDVDGIQANGCECERFDGMGPPPVVGGDADCDGVPDDTDDFIYVTTTGSDTNPGTLVRPMRTIQAALMRGRTADKDVLVARGVYDGPFDVVGGVSIFGGYSPDFRDRDLALYPVLVERRDLPPGSPVLTCRGVTAATRVEGFIVAGSDATAPGEGSTAVWLDGCGPMVRLAFVEVLAGRGGDGRRGVDSSGNLTMWGLMSLTQLNGTSGGMGRPGNAEGETCRTVTAGTAGAKMCPRGNVGGGAGGTAGCPESGCVNGRPCGNAGCTDFTVGDVCDFAEVLRRAVPNGAAGAGRSAVGGARGGAAGELTYNAPTNRTVCNFCDDNPTLARTGGNGGDGEVGTDGTGGNGCMGAPRIDAMSGRVSGGAGSDGTNGNDGAGGGGATAGGGYDVIGGTDPGCDDRSGGSGGGGGSGGCGAPGATGGGGGGASIGIAIRLGARMTSGPTMEMVRVVTASGGHGGDGGIGAEGGSGGAGGAGGVGRFWCARTGGRGGDGGQGGAGGGGGGGCGGGTHGVFISAGGRDVSGYRTTIETTVTVDEAGIPGRAGAGGFSPGTGAPGTSGLAGSADTIHAE